ncbi:MAG: amidohydrolase family protein, partial [Betaproteobacteria bacterium]
RSAGTFARVLGRYVRELQVISLMEGLRKMTLMPAQRLEARVPAMRNKGRIRVGADADLTVFDPASIIDVATFEHPAEFSSGVKYVFVAGDAVVENGVPQRDRHPGRPIRAPISTH